MPGDDVRAESESAVSAFVYALQSTGVITPLLLSRLLRGDFHIENHPQCRYNSTADGYIIAY